MSLPDPEAMYFAVIEASPQIGTEAFQKYDGAHISCWIKPPDLKIGRARATSFVEQHGWFVKGVKEEKIITASHYESTNEGLRYFNQALTDEEVCVVHTFPLQSRR